MVTPISTRRLCFDILNVRKEELLALVADADAYYRPYQQRKKKKDGSTKVRNIEPSTDYLKKIQKRIDRNILKPAMVTMPYEIMGGRTGMSVIMNGHHHANSKAFMKYDVKNFFPSIEYRHVYYIFRYRLNYCEEAANILTKLTTFPSSKPHVPQGAPTSTSLSMFSLEPMCIRLKAHADSYGLKFSIWIDDITISGDPKVLATHRKTMNHIVNTTPFTIHPDKDTGIIKKGAKVGNEKGRRVTGIVIDNTDRLTLGNTKLKSLQRRVRRIKQESPSLRGSLLFLRQVSPSQGKKLFHEYKTKIAANKK